MSPLKKTAWPRSIGVRLVSNGFTKKKLSLKMGNAQGAAVRSLKDELLELERRLNGVQVAQNKQMLALEQKLSEFDRVPHRSVGGSSMSAFDYCNLYMYGVPICCQEGFNVLFCFLISN